MAHESFEDPETAELMNRLFINIKVDREERPDLDRIYQVAHQLITQRPGGWPLTMFLTPDDHTPFFGGTYFPKYPRHGLPAFRDVLQRIASFYRDHRGEIDTQSQSIRDVFARIEPEPVSGETQLHSTPLEHARTALEADFDPERGGFGRAPKFPHPTSIERLLRHWQRSVRRGNEDRRALYMTVRTLEHMARGGIYDQLGGGFSRYSIDDYWMIPHFEKMLYDNAALLATFATGYQATKQPLFARISIETAEWIMREMQAPEGGYYSALDADSEGKEGKYYVWMREEIEATLDTAIYPLFARRFGLDRPANFEDHWHLHAFVSVDDLAHEFEQPQDEIRECLNAARHALLVVRERRVRPQRDEKILTAWNGLAIRGMAIAARIMARDELAQSASRAVDFIRARLWVDGRLLASYKDGRARFCGYLDDHAFLLDGLIELLQTRWRRDDLEFAIEIAEALLAHFADTQGGFYFTSDDHETLIHRPKPFGDEATPAGNAIAARALARLGFLLSEPRYLDAAERTLRAGWHALDRYPQMHMSLLDVLEEYLEPPAAFIVRAPADRVCAWRQAAMRRYAPDRLVFVIPADEEDLPRGLASKTPRREAVGYVCEGLSCAAPLSEEELTERFGVD